MVFHSAASNLTTIPRAPSNSIFTDVYVASIEVSAALLNISTRLQVQTGDNVLIGGFVVTGDQPKKMVLRAIGPSLAGAGLEGALVNPTLELFDQSGAAIRSNDDWRENQHDIEATGIPPSDRREAAIVGTFAPGAYTAVVRGKQDGTGVGLVEAYDLEQTASSKLANISTRGFVRGEQNVMIGGLIAGGGGGGRSVDCIAQQRRRSRRSK
ncbi:MAG TPA: hypothetical protein VK993_06400 [Chthoniobacterales bacterium]|nr:hypothetical protein [Chthoniobacterales bacterium]